MLGLLGANLAAMRKEWALVKEQETNSLSWEEVGQMKDMLRSLEGQQGWGRLDGDGVMEGVDYVVWSGGTGWAGLDRMWGGGGDEGNG